jgi:adenylate cyclase
MSGSRLQKDLPAAPGTERPAPDAFTADDIHRQLQRILGCGQFRHSLRLTRFLTFVVSTALTAKPECLKAYTIATQALGRGSDFDPQNDPIVRVEAGRLRQALERYYAEAGYDDPLVIDLPRGGYMPSFRRRDAAPPASQAKHECQVSADTIANTSASPSPAETPHAETSAVTPLQRRIGSALGPANRVSLRGRIGRLAFAAVAALAILEVFFDIHRPLTGGPNHGLWYKLRPASNAVASQATGGEGAPIIYVEPVSTVGQPVEGLFPAKIIRERLINALARYDDVTVVTSEPDSAASHGAAESELRRTRSFYRLASTVRYGGEEASLIVQLIDTADSSLAWSRQYDRPVKPHPRRPNGSIAPDVARSLLDPFGNIQARERVKLAAADPMKVTYRCILDANVYLRSFNPSQYQPVRDCLAHASEEEPHAVTVFADLAFVYLRNYRFGIAASPGDPAMLEDAYAMAARAVDIKPESAFAQYALGAVLLARGDIARAKIASDKSYRLNPDNGAIAFGHATILVLTGENDAGLALLNKSSAKSPNSWIGYHLLMALGCYLKGELKTAGAESGQIANPFFPPGLVIDALVANKAGDRARAQQDIAMLYQFYPAWHEHFRASVGRYLPDSAMADHIAADFKAAAADTVQ